jgi:hypothetical protein
MLQKSLALRANLENPDRGTQQEAIPGRITPCPEPCGGRRLARICFKFGGCFFHRWFNLYDLGLETDLYVLPLLRRFTETDSRHVAARHGTAVPQACDFPEADHFPELEYAPASPARESKSGIPWKSPWLYVSALVLAWLFVL